MAHVELFTDKVPGAIEGLGDQVQLCPRCRQAGIERHTAEGPVFVHAESSEILSDGLLTVPIEACPLDHLPFDVHRKGVI
jgi:hypothetical protein